jgi:FimV-like protein
MPPAKAGEIARKNAVEALSIDGSLAEAHASLGLINVNHGWDFGAGEKELGRAIELNPNYAPAYLWYGVLRNFQRRYEEGHVMVLKALSLDPFSLVIRQGLGVTLLGLGRYQEAMDMFRKVEEESPNLPSVHYWMSIVHTILARGSEAVEEAKKEVESDNFDPGAKLDLAFAYSEAGEKEEAARILEEVLGTKDVYFSPCGVGILMLSLGRGAEAASWMKRALDERDSSLLYFRSVPAYSRYLSTPEGREADEKMGLGSPPSS